MKRSKGSLNELSLAPRIRRPGFDREDHIMPVSRRSVALSAFEGRIRFPGSSHGTEA